MKKAQQVTAALYEGDFAALSSLTQAEMKSVFAGAKIQNVMLEPGMTVLDLALKAKIYKHDREFNDIRRRFLKNIHGNLFLCLISGEASRLISAGGFYINQNRCQNIAEIISPSVHILANNYTLLRTGSRNYYLINWKN